MHPSIHDVTDFFFVTVFVSAALKVATLWCCAFRVVPVVAKLVYKSEYLNLFSFQDMPFLVIFSEFFKKFGLKSVTKK